MMISDCDALITVLLTTASSTKSIGKLSPFGGYESGEFPISQIDVPISSSQQSVYAAHAKAIPHLRDSDAQG
jgi:hypothetical protein